MITKPYILFTSIPLIKNHQGNIFCDLLWEKDLKLHLNYIENFGICCPMEYQEDVEGLIDITDMGIKWFFELKKDYGLKSVLLNLMPNFATARKACKEAMVVHSGGAGWAFPLSFYLLFLKPFFKFQWIMVIESSFWMLEPGDKRTPRKIIEHYLHKVLLTQCVKLADARIFTQTYYRTFFLGDDKDRTLINPATWINKGDITTAEIVKNRFQERSDNTLKIIFPSRLVEDKGVLIVLEAIEKLKVAPKTIQITIMGTGDLEQQCKDFVTHYRGDVDVVFEKPVAYGKVFLEKLTHYDFVLVPTLKQEQPRIIFDAFSQGVPVIGSDTSGIQDVTNNQNTVTFIKGNSSSLADVISSLKRTPDTALEMGLAGLEYAAGKTHLQMHKDRESFLISVL